ncbi:hypothetical protein ACJX0J_010525, partial [Zea mays]
YFDCTLDLNKFFGVNFWLNRIINIVIVIYNFVKNKLFCFFIISVHIAADALQHTGIIKNFLLSGKNDNVISVETMHSAVNRLTMNLTKCWTKYVWHLWGAEVLIVLTLTDLEAKRSKTNKSSNNKGSLRTEVETDSRSAGKAVSKNIPAAEPPKQDYIHVRARRGQATDSHSLAERARREKISERMKVLQDLVPGCNKVIGKASVLDEIINYIQSLQCQVEFLSMKLEAVNAQANQGVEVFPAKD